MEISYPVVVTKDGGHDCWDTTVTAREIQRAMLSGMVENDPKNQRGRDNVTGKDKVDWARVEKWAHDLIADKAIFGQLTWNFRPEETGTIRFVPDISADGTPSRTHGALVIEDGQAKIPDSRHRHEAIRQAVEAEYKGADFDVTRRFSLRIWSVPEEYERAIFYAMNMEHKKADAARAKSMFQDNAPQKLAAGLVKGSPHLGEVNVETVSNTVSVKNPRLAGFNTFAAAFETADSPWSKTPEEGVAERVEFLIVFWDKLVQVVPELGKLAISERQSARSDPDRSLASSALAIHGYLRMAHSLYPDGDLEVLGKLGGNGGFFNPLVNPAYRDRGVAVPGTGKNLGKLILRSSHASRREITKIFAEHCGLA